MGMGMCNKISLFVINGFILFIGIAVVAMSSMFINTGADFRVIMDQKAINLPIAALVFGILIILTACFGFVATSMQSKMLLRVYSGILFALLIAEMVVGIMILVDVNIPENDIKRNMDEVFNNYANDTELADDLDNIQRFYFCCGVRGYSDWANYTYGLQYPNSVPDSCCAPDYYEDGCGFQVLLKPDVEDRLNPSGCYWVMAFAIGALELSLGVLLIIFAIVQAVSTLCACGFALNAAR